MGDERVLVDRDGEWGIARITLNNPARRNAYDPPMRRQLGQALDELAGDDAIKVILLRGADGVFSTGADMSNAYRWYSTNGDVDARKRPSQRRRLAVDRESFGFYHAWMNYPKVTVAEVQGYALGGGFELALLADVSVVASDAKVGMPAARFLGPALGSIHTFIYRLGPTLARRLLLTGDIIPAGELPRGDVFTEVLPTETVPARAEWWAQRISRMPADGLAIAKEAFRLVEHLQSYQAEEVISPLIHAFATNLQFAEGDFNFVKVRAEHGTSAAFRMRDEHFEIPEP